MKGDQRYQPWLRIADELEAFHQMAYGLGGYLETAQSRPTQPTAMSAATWIRHKCAAGWWYWWDKSTLCSVAQAPLRALQRVTSEANWDADEEGLRFIAEIDRLMLRIGNVAKGVQPN